MNLKERANKLMVDVPAVFLAMKEKRTPWYAKALAVLIVAYALSPVDLIPDFIPVIGYLDDILLLPVLIALCVKLIPRDVLDECRAKSAGLWQGGKPKKWYYALPVVLLWLLIIAVLVYAATRQPRVLSTAFGFCSLPSRILGAQPQKC